jgi:predicted AlkP superfamily phosphohydrolase/phosphomutase
VITQLRVSRLRVIVAGVAIALAAAACGSSRSMSTQRRLLLVGIDAADWRVVNALIARGAMPNMSRLMKDGVHCDLRSLEPKQKSPVIWATIATGKVPAKHGIEDYIDPGTKKLMTSNMLRARSIWEILGERGLSVTVIGWLLSWPATEVNGFMVTDYFRRPRRPDRPLPERLTYPDGLAAEIDDLRVSPEDLTDEDLSRFASFEDALTAHEAQQLPLADMFDEMRAIEGLEQQAYSLKDILAGDRTFMKVADHLMRSSRTDVLMIYLRGVDTVSHRFWASAHPREVGFRVSRTEVRVFGKTVERYYEYADEMLGELVDGFGEGATVILCSDHGFDGPKPGQLPGGINDHGPVGVLIMAGPGIKEGVRIAEQNVADITPTILALYGLPVADDMDGEMIADALTEDFLSRHPVTTTETYELVGN